MKRIQCICKKCKQNYFYLEGNQEQAYPKELYKTFCRECRSSVGRSVNMIDRQITKLLEMQTVTGDRITTLGELRNYLIETGDSEATSKHHCWSLNFFGYQGDKLKGDTVGDNERSSSRKRNSESKERIEHRKNGGRSTKKGQLDSVAETKNTLPIA